MTLGSQMALFLAAQAIAVPDMAIAVENPGYSLAITAFRAAGVQVVPIEVDEGGMSIDGLEGALAHDPSIRVVYVTPHHQYPTTVTMGASRPLRLIGLARTAWLTILEDDYDHDYRFEGAPVLPIAARAAGELSTWDRCPSCSLREFGWTMSSLRRIWWRAWRRCVRESTGRVTVRWRKPWR
ncbi:aminotransferase class I/II-fold pyridoxal phosphate-dependent enzyme [Altererythrobacter sp. FM1]|nr:aminotransferase class I/II-fold pyridoxal phosphate-dependent enzyme [Altererythrobacter sp. FM1]